MQSEPSPATAPLAPAGTPAPTSAWCAALPLALTAASALLLGTVGYLVVGFGVLSSCTNDYSCTQTGCAPCQDAQQWLGAGAAGQGLLVITAVVLLVLAGVRRGTRRRLAAAGWALLAISIAWIVATAAVAESSY